MVLVNLRVHKFAKPNYLNKYIKIQIVENNKPISKDKNKMISNKKAQSEYPVIFIYRFLIIILVIGVIVGVVWWRFSQPYDVRPMEANALAKASISCLTNDSILVLNNFNEKTISDCLEIDKENLFMNFTLGEEGEKFLAIGNKDLEPYCGTKATGKNLPLCFNQNFRVLDSNYVMNDLHVLIAINKQEKNV